MVKKFKVTGIILIISLSIAIIGFAAFFRYAPQIGGIPEGKRLQRMESGDNYKLGKFHNVVSTKMELKSGKMLNVMWEFIKGSDAREPKKIIKVEAFNKEEFTKTDATQVSFAWFGHSSILLKIDGKTLLIDPVFSERASMFSSMGPRRFKYSQIMDVDLLPDLDAVLISHDHYDHLDYKVIKKLTGRVNRFFVPLSVGAHLEKWGVSPDNIVELNWWESVGFEGIKLVFTPSRHFSGRGLNNRFSTLWGSWVIIGAQRKIFFGGDSGYFPGFKMIGDRFGPFDLTFLECGAYNENWSEIHMMPEETVQAHVDLNGTYLMPIHWGKFNLSLHPWKEPIERALIKGKELGVKIVTPKIGATVILDDSLNTTPWWKDYK